MCGLFQHLVPVKCFNVGRKQEYLMPKLSTCATRQQEAHKCALSILTVWRQGLSLHALLLLFISHSYMHPLTIAISNQSEDLSSKLQVCLSQPAADAMQSTTGIVMIGAK